MCIGIGGFLLMRRLWAKVVVWWEDAKEGGAILGDRRAFMLRVFLPSLLGWIASLGVMAVFLSAYDIPVSFHTLMRLCGGNSIANVTSATPGGAGVNQAFNVASLKGVASPQDATAYSVAQQLVTTAWNIVFAIIMLVWAFGWSGGKELVGDSYEGAKAKAAEQKAARDERKAAKRKARAAMLSPTTLSFSVLALVLGDRPLRTGFWFYLGALSATLVIGVVAAFVLGDAAASKTPSSPKTWVAIVDLVAAGAILGWVAVIARRPPNPARATAMIEKMSGLATASVAAIAGAGAGLANPGGFIPLALKNISETDPSATGYVVDWVFFALVSLLPLALALLSLLVARDWTVRLLAAARGWLERNARTVFLVLLALLATSLLRNGIAGLTD